jgi:hypothetical protein
MLCLEFRHSGFRLPKREPRPLPKGGVSGAFLCHGVVKSGLCERNIWGAPNFRRDGDPRSGIIAGTLMPGARVQ